MLSCEIFYFYRISVFKAVIFITFPFMFLTDFIFAKLFTQHTSFSNSSMRAIRSQKRHEIANFLIPFVRKVFTITATSSGHNYIGKIDEFLVYFLAVFIRYIRRVIHMRLFHLFPRCKIIFKLLYVIR